ncbi:MAG: helix-turn-helix domain-containing protein [Anaerolineales bacterium]
MGEDYISLEEAAQRSGLHVNTIRRLLRAGVLRGYKTAERGKRRWMVSAASLREYADPIYGFLLEMPGPKLFLRKQDETKDREAGLRTEDKR